MNGKIAAVLLSGLLFACVQAPPGPITESFFHSLAIERAISVGTTSPALMMASTVATESCVSSVYWPGG